MPEFDDFQDFELNLDDLMGLDLTDTSKDMRDKVIQALLSDEKFNKFTQKITNMVLEKFRDHTTTGLDPIMFILTLTKDFKMGITVIPIPQTGRDHGEQCEIFGAIGRAFASTGIGIPLAVYSGTEAWIVKKSKEEGYDYERDGLPSQHPDRQEVIVGTCTTIDGRTAMAISDIDRGPNNEMLVTHTDINYYKGGSSDRAQDNLTPKFFQGYGSKTFSNILKDITQKEPKAPVIDNNTADQLIKSWD